MLLRDLLTDKPIDIMVRTYDPDGDDMLFGYCKWDGEKLISCDGDTYYEDDIVDKYEFDQAGNLTYWFNGTWIQLR